jgi:iron complex outermembrane receptor protein
MNLRKVHTRPLGNLPLARRSSDVLRYAIAAAIGSVSLHAATALAQVDEIIVTTEFREASVQETPVAVTAVNAEMLNARGQTNIVDVANQAPNVTMTPAGQAAGSAMITFIRGIGQTDFNYALEPGVGFYVDDIYYPNLTGSMVELLDIERVEVARGPQGTLAGRNSIGGSVKIYSLEPTHGSNSGEAELTIGNFDQIAVKGSADLTFVEDKLSARISGVSSSRNGYVTRVDYKCTHPSWPGPTFQNGRLDNCKLGDLGGENFTGGRFSLLWTPSDRVRVKVLGDLINQDNESAALVLTRVTNSRHLPQPPPAAGPLTGTGQFNPANTTGATSATGAGIPGTSPLGTQEGTFLDVDGNMTTLGDRVYLNSQFVTHGQYRGDPLINDPYTTYATFLDPMPPQTNRPYSPQTVDPGVEFDDQGLSVHIDWDLSDNLSLKWISAWREYEDVFAYDTDGTPFFSQGGTQGLKHEHMTHELRLSGTGLNERLDYTVGAYYVDQKLAQHIGQIDLYYAQLNFIHGPDPTPSDSQAIFAHTAWHLTENMDLSLGYRMTEDSKFYQWQRHNPDGSNITAPCTAGVVGGGNSLANLPNCAIFGFSGLGQTFESDRDDYRIALDYFLTDNVMLYGSFATGYKGGGINPRPFFAVQIATFGEEEVETTELGLKATLADGRVRLNTAFFQNDQKGIQLNQAVCEVPGAGGVITIGPPCAKPANVGDAETEGLELELDISATDRLSFDLMASSIDFQYTRLDPSVGSPLFVPNGRGQMDYTMKTPYTPELTWSAGVQYEFPLSGGGTITARLDGSYQDEVYTQAVNYTNALLPGGAPLQPLNDRQTAWIDEYTLAHLRLSWRSGDGEWETAIDVANLTDEVYYQNIVDGVYTTIGYQAAVIAPPRTWTAAFRKSFGL